MMIIYNCPILDNEQFSQWWNQRVGIDEKNCLYLHIDTPDRHHQHPE